MSTPPTIESPRSQPTKLVFTGVFCLWAKPRLPPDVTSVDPATIKPSGSSSPVVVPNSSAAGALAADLLRLELRHGYLRRWRSPGGIRHQLDLAAVIFSLSRNDMNSERGFKLPLQFVQQMQHLGPLLSSVVHSCPSEQDSDCEGLAA